MPAWTRDETILTLELYLASGHRVLEPHHARMVELCETINRIRRNDLNMVDPSYRMASSIKAKMANLRALDPTTQSTGWGNGSALDRKVWEEFADDAEHLAETARQIRSAADRPN